MQYLREYLDTLYSDYSVCMSVHIWKHTHVYLKRHLCTFEKSSHGYSICRHDQKSARVVVLYLHMKILEFSVGFERILRHSIWRHSSKSAHCSFLIWVHVSILNLVQYLTRLLSILRYQKMSKVRSTAQLKIVKSQLYIVVVCSEWNCDTAL